MTTGPISGLSPRAERLIRTFSTITVLGLAVSAAILSFAGLQQLSLRAGISHSIAWLLPVVIDGMVLTGSLGVVSSSLVGIGTWYPWTLTIVGVVASVAGNVAIAPPNLSSRLVHSAGPLVFALSIEGLLRIFRASAIASLQRERAKLAKEEREHEKEMRKLDRAQRAASKVVEQSALPTYEVVPSPSPVKPKEASPREQLEVAESTSKTKTRDRIRELWLANPNIGGAEIKRRIGIDPSYSRKTLAYLREHESHLLESNSKDAQPVIVIAQVESKQTVASIAPVVEASTSIVENIPTPVLEEAELPFEF